MKLTNLLSFANIIYDSNKLFNSVKRKNENTHTLASTSLKILIAGLFTKTGSINKMMKGIHDSVNNRFKNLFYKREFIPKTHAFRDCINDIDYKDVADIHYKMLNRMKENKVFENHTYRGSRTMIIDGIEAFETNKDIEGLHIRNHKDGSVGHYYKSLGLMYLTDDVDIMIDMVPFENMDVKDDKEYNQKIKSEGEITVFKKIIPQLEEYKIDVCVLDCMFLNGPCLNAAKEKNINAIVKMTDTRRELYKDASKLFEIQKPKREYEIVEVIVNKKTKYSKKMKKKDTQQSEKYTYTRELTEVELKKPIVIKEETEETSNKTVIKKTIEKVLKKVKVYADNFEMNNYDYGKVKVIKVIETVKEKEKIVDKEMYIVTTLLNEDLEFIVDLMHRRWDIELKGFRKLKDRYNIDHLYIGSDNAIRLTMYLAMIVYNLVELYFNVHTKKYKHKINFENLFEDYKIEIFITKDFYKYFLL